MAALLEVHDLVTRFATAHGTVRAVDGVSFALDEGETLGIVGESGCGKSALGLSIMGLIDPPGRVASGRILFRGRDLCTLPEEALRRLRGREISMVFQDPGATLDPVLKVGDQIAEMFRYHGRVGPGEARTRVLEMLTEVGISEPERRYRAYPHELSGGMQQRIIIACALILRPRLVVADEPTTALDVTVQAQILALMRTLRDSERGTAFILISHDLGVIAEMCERVCVMYAGNIVEAAAVDTILAAPKHPYTVGLIASIPRIDADDQVLAAIPGSVADPIRPPSGCKFHPRCPHAMARCRTEVPHLRASDGGTMVACHLF